MLADIGEFIPNISTTACTVRAHLVRWDRLCELATSNWQSGQINRPCSFARCRAHYQEATSGHVMSCGVATS